MEEGSRTFEELNKAVKALDDLILIKKNELAGKEKQNLAKVAELEEKLASLQDVSENVINNIDDIINKLSKVLENNGAGDNIS